MTDMQRDYPPEFDGPVNQDEADALTAEAERQHREWDALDFWTDHEHLNPDRLARAIDRARDEHKEGR